MVYLFPWVALVASFILSNRLVSSTRLDARIVETTGSAVWTSPSATTAIGQCYPLAFNFTTPSAPLYVQVLSFNGSEQIRNTIKNYSIPSTLDPVWVDATTPLTFTISEFPYAAGTTVYIQLRASDGLSLLQGTGFTVQPSDVSDCLSIESTDWVATETGQGFFTTFTAGGFRVAASTTLLSSSSSYASPAFNSSSISYGNVTSNAKTYAGAIGGAIVGGVVAVGLFLGVFVWKRTRDRRERPHRRLNLAESDEKLPESGAQLPPPAPEPWSYSELIRTSSLPVSGLNYGSRARDGGPANDDGLDVLPPFYSDATARGSVAPTSPFVRCPTKPGRAVLSPLRIV